MDRRNLLRGLALGILGATGGYRTALADGGPAAAPARDPRPPAPSGVLNKLPGGGDQFAFTIDDGTSGDVVAAYANLARDAGLRLTFFPNGVYRSWADNAALLRP